MFIGMSCMNHDHKQRCEAWTWAMSMNDQHQTWPWQSCTCMMHDLAEHKPCTCEKAYACVHVKALKRWVVLFLAYCLLLAMSTSWTIDDLKKEMDDVVKLVQQKQKSLKDGTDTTAFQKRLCAGVICKLEQINDMTVGKALELYQHVDAINMTDDMKNMIKAKLDDVLENDNRSPQRPDGLTFTVKPQYINLPAYLTASDWDLLKTSSSYHAKIRCICCRLKSLGLVSLAEKVLDQQWQLCSAHWQLSQRQASFTNWCKTSSYHSWVHHNVMQHHWSISTPTPRILLC